jgi:hypothetical protein
VTELVKAAPMLEASKPEEIPAILSGEPEPSQPKAEQISPFPPKLVDSISIKDANEVKVELPHLQAEFKPLEQDELERYWNEAAEELELTEVMKNATVRLGEHQGCFEVDAQTVYFAEDFRSHKMAVLERIREKTGMKMLDCRVNPLFVAQEEKAYNPDDKYKAMLEENRKLALLRNLFPEIDY